MKSTRPATRPAPVTQSFAGGCRQCGSLEQSSPGNYVLLLEPARRRRLADHRRDLHPGAQDPLERRARRGQAVRFFDWAYKYGDAARDPALDYVPLPGAVKAMVRKQWATNITSGGKPVYVAK
jgi:phosphate transport system substrate-binding protein